jgi:hypothetical protein
MLAGADDDEAAPFNPMQWNSPPGAGSDVGG